MLSLPVIITKVSTTKDKSFEIKMETQDKSTLDAVQKAALLDLIDEFAFVGFRMGDKPIEQMDVPDVVPEFKGDKTPSQRLRAVLYVLWEQTKPQEEFEPYYRRQIEKIIDSVKSKLS